MTLILRIPLDNWEWLVMWSTRLHTSYCKRKINQDKDVITCLNIFSLVMHVMLFSLLYCCCVFYETSCSYHGNTWNCSYWKYSDTDPAWYLRILFLWSRINTILWKTKTAAWKNLNCSLKKRKLLLELLFSKFELI